MSFQASRFFVKRPQADLASDAGRHLLVPIAISIASLPGLSCALSPGAKANPRHFRKATPAMNNSMLPLPGLSPVSGKTVVAKFDGGLLSSDGGILVLREVEQRLRVADRLAACMVDPRAPELITHTLAEIIRFRLLMISAGLRRRQRRLHYEAIRCSRWRSIYHRPIANCVRSRPSPVWKTCPMLAPCCAWAAPWSIFIASPSSRSQTDHARHRRHVRRGPWRPAVAAVQCTLRRIRLSADRRVRWRRSLRHCCSSSRQTARRQGDPRLPAPPVARDPRQLAQDRDPTARRQSLLQSRGSRLVSGQRSRLHPGRRADHDIAPAYRGSRGQHEGALRGRAEQTARRAASRSSLTGPRAGAASSASSPASKLARTGPTHASSSPISTPAMPRAL